MGELQRGIDNLSVSFNSDPFDRLLSSEPSAKYRLSSAEDFYDYLSTLPLDPVNKQTLGRKLQ